MIEQLIFTDVAAVAGVPIPYLTLNTVGPTIMRFGTEEQKDYFLPRILAGDLHFSIGYSEPGSGTHLASLEDEGGAGIGEDEWVINGQKMWTSLIQYADWIWLALPDRSRPAPAQGPVHDPGAGRLPRLLLHARCTRSPACTPAPTYFKDVRIPGVHPPGRRAQRRLVADDQPAQPRARGP